MGDKMEELNDRQKANKDTLDELNKGCAMGMDAIKDILAKVEDKEFKKVLEDEHDKYKVIHQRIEDKYSDFSDEEPTTTSVMNKVMTGWMTDMKLMTDHSDSKIAELLLQGTNMGIIEGRKLLNNKDNDKKTKDLIQEYVDFQEEYVEKLKEFL